MKVVAVLSGDLIDSSHYEKKTLTSVLKVLKNEFKTLKEQFPKETMSFSIYRGDSFQGVIENPVLALQIALQIKAAVSSYTEKEHLPKNAMPVADIRISIGVGEAEYQPDALAESNGEAFNFSGRTLDKMKSEGRKMAITTANENLNDELNVYLKFLDATTDRWSVASAEVVYYLINGYKEQEIADLLKRSQAAINLRKKAASWEEIKLLLKRYKTIAKTHFA